ncbi:MAG: ATP-binding protein [Bacteroidia bacterium]
MSNTSSIKRIAIVGPESTGKSELAEALALYYKTLWVREYAREYLNTLSRDYVYDDLLEMAKGQMLSEDETARMVGGDANHGESIVLRQWQISGLFCDTNLTVIKVWSEFKYARCDEWILNEIKSRKYFLHLLTDIDLPWQPDPLREHPHERKELFEIYLNELKNQQVDFEIVSGVGDERLANAVRIIDSRL